MPGSLEPVLGYLPVAILSLFLNAADIYFLQSERTPPLHRSPSFWLYMAGQLLLATFAAYLLYTKAGFVAADWPVVTVIAAFSGFSLLQSLTVKFGDKGIDARDLFDSWKRRVVEDVSKSNASRKRARIHEVSIELARHNAADPPLLEQAIYQLAPSVQLNPADVVAQSKAAGFNPQLMMAWWIASVDLEFAETLLKARAP